MGCRENTRSKANRNNRPAGKSAKKKSSVTAQVGLQVGQRAPAFSLQDQDGVAVSLSDFAGKKVVLYFYPKDDTPGCTREACAFRDGSEQMRSSGAVVIGVSVDAASSHARFRAKYGLTFPLLADVDRRVVQAYGVWKEKSLYGRTYMGTERTTFIIDEQGRIARVFAEVKVDGHLDEVLAAL